MEDTISKLRDLLLSQSKAGRLRALLDSVYGAPVTTPGMLGIQHQQSASQTDPALERYMAGKESAARGVPLEAPAFSPDDLIGSGLFKGMLGLGALAGSIKSVGKAVPQAEALHFAQLEAMRLAQLRAALPVEQGGLGLPANNTPQMRADAMFPIDTYHGTDKDILDMKPGKGRFGKGIYTSNSPKRASGYAESYDSGQNVIPLRSTEPDLNYVRGEINRFDSPDMIRSRFAAFDPWRRTAAIAAAMGVSAPDLLAKERDDKR